MISWARIMVSTPCLYASTSKVLSGRRNFMRLSDERLHAESSKCMYSEHGLEALIRPLFGTVCQSLIVVSNWIPGSPHWCAASAIMPMRSRALYVSTTSPVTTARVDQEASLSSACMNSSLTRTELFEFWKKIEEYAGPLSEGL